MVQRFFSVLLSLFFLASLASALEIEQKIEGEVAESLESRWFLVTTLRTVNGAVVNIPYVLTATDAEFDMRVLALPDEMQKKVDAANLAKETWVPSSDEIKTVAADVKKLVRSLEDTFGSVKYRFVTREHYDDVIKADEMSKESFAVLIVSQFPHHKNAKPGEGRLSRNDHVYYIDRHDTDAIEGRHIQLQLLAAPFPMPITLKGDFKAYPLVR